jgi:Dolichyl-phosphate-mannose-protein mannosyltransferase
VRRLAQLAGRRFLGLELGLVALWAGLAFVLSLVTAQVADWNAMTDELVYERLAIAIGQTHSVLPRLHGELVRSLAQLYPLSISPYFVHGYVPEDLRNAHIWNAWLMSSACIPAFLLARRVTARRSTAYALALLTVCLPWIVYSTTLLTEVAGYPAFLWAILGMHKALTEPSPRNDVRAVLGLALAFFARTQFLLLATTALGRSTRCGRTAFSPRCTADSPSPRSSSSPPAATRST